LCKSLIIKDLQRRGPRCKSLIFKDLRVFLCRITIAQNHLTQ
jgi:hypothetical protein